MAEQNRITQVLIKLREHDNEGLLVEVTKEFDPEYGGGSHVFQEDGGQSWHYALDIAREMVTLSPANKPAKPLLEWTALGDGHYRFTAPGWWADVRIWWSATSNDWAGRVIETNSVMQHATIVALALVAIGVKKGD